MYLFSVTMPVFEGLICQSKVSHLTDVVLVNKHISSSKVTMNYLQHTKPGTNYH